jgi:2-alkenal reductase
MKTLKGKIAIIFIALLMVGAAFGLGTSCSLGTDSTSATTVINSQNTVSATPSLYNEDTVASIYENASPAVVQIDITQTTNSFFGKSTQEGLGSGFLIDNQGHILTNNHVVDGATTVEVILKDGTTLNAEVLGTNTIHDLAVISVDASAVSGITPLQLGDSSLVKPGQMAIALGNPYGYANSITVGVISGLNRTLSGTNSTLTGLIQTDAALNQGNSGGPLLDSQGMVIGINTAVETNGIGTNGIGFAVPSNDAAKALPDLIAGKKIIRPWLGISGIALSQTIAAELEISTNQGVYVVSVVANSPAEKAGLQAGGTNNDGTLASGGDIITAADGNSVSSVEELSAYLSTKQVGDNVNLIVLRGGESITVQVTLAAWPDSIPSENTPQLPNQIPDWPWGGRDQQEPGSVY